MRRIRRKTFKKRILLYVFFIVLFFLGTSYSLLSQNLTFSGTILLPESDTIKLDVKLYDIETINMIFLKRYALRVDITNNSPIDVTNWKLVIDTSGTTNPKKSNWPFTDTYPANFTTITTENGQSTVIGAVGTTEGTIRAGETHTSWIIFDSLNNGFVPKLISAYSEKNPTTTFNSIALEPDNSEITEKPVADIEELQSFQYKKDNLVFSVDFKDSLREIDGKYETIAIINIANNNDKNISNLRFDIKYNEENLYYGEVKSSSLEQISNSSILSSYKLVEFDSIDKNSSRTYQITGIVSDQRFKSFTISNVKYEFEIEEDNKNNNEEIDKNNQNLINNENKNEINNKQEAENSVQKDSNIVINNTVEVSNDYTNIVN